MPKLSTTGISLCMGCPEYMPVLHASRALREVEDQVDWLWILTPHHEAEAGALLCVPGSAEVEDGRRNREGQGPDVSIYS
jgi:hypothetical protein